MPVPTHSNSCETWIYQTTCWHCGASISVLQCTCGSAVLFNTEKPSSDRHSCSGGIGDSGYSGWEAIDVLRSQGMPITPEIINVTFGQKPKNNPQKTKDRNIIRCTPTEGQDIERIFNLSEFNKETANTIEVNGFSDMARELQGIPKGENNFNQITFISNNEKTIESYTALIAKNKIPRNIKSLLNQRAVFFVRLKGLKNWWIVESIEVI